MIALLVSLAAISIAPTPEPRVKWESYPAGGYILCEPYNKSGPSRCITLPPGSYIVVPIITTQPDPEEEKRKS